MGYISTASAAPIPHASITALLKGHARTIGWVTPASPVPANTVHLQRRRIESAIDALITLLDALDGDSDVEPNGDEHDFTEAAEEDWQGLVADCEPGTPEDAEEDNEDCSELEHAAAWGNNASTCHEPARHGQ